MLVFGCFAVLGGLLTLLLPETRDLEFPDTFEEAEALGKVLDRQATGRTNGVMDDKKFPQESNVVFDSNNMDKEENIRL